MRGRTPDPPPGAGGLTIAPIYTQGNFERGIAMAEHGTRTMYTHYGCRCEACCRAEHQQYLKRAETKKRQRNISKWDDTPEPKKKEARKEAKRVLYRNRYDALKNRPSVHTRFIRWEELAESFEMRCAICGCKCDPNDMWISENGRKCFGRKYPTVDHIIPLKLGGADTFDNVQLTCKRCNSAKGARA